MKKLTLFVTLFVTFFVVSTFSKTYEVKMLNNSKTEGQMAFEPGFLKIELGDTVHFVATDKGHNSESIYTPEGATEWEGKWNEDITVIPDKEGVYVYQCEPHNVMAMIGIIQVGKAGDLKPVKKALKKLSRKVALNKKRPKKYYKQIVQDPS